MKTILALLVLLLPAACREPEACAMEANDRETLTNEQMKCRNDALELAAQYFSAMGAEKVYSVAQIANAIRSLKVERSLPDSR